MRSVRRRLHLYLLLVLAINGFLLSWRYLAPGPPRMPLIMNDDPSATPQARCPEYSAYAWLAHEPLTGGKYNLPYQRPSPDCRKLNLPEVEETIEDMRGLVEDPDLFRLFENCFPNTLDTAISWTGLAANSTEDELTFITTGDIPAMWLRDSANQLQSYVSLLTPNSSPDSLAGLFRGAINLQSRFILAAPHCNAFSAPPEALNNPPSPADINNSGGSLFTPGSAGGTTDFVMPPFPPGVVWECKYELDSLAAFLQLSWDYFSRTADLAFFTARESSNWALAVSRLLDILADMRQPTYDEDTGAPRFPPYSFQRHTSVATETLGNNGAGNPVRGGTGLVRSAFRPSDDACTYQFLVPANMMLARYLGECAGIMEGVDGEVAARMREVAEGVREGLEKYGRVRHAVFGEVYAYEVDGFGSANLMDDANLPSLLSAPLMGYLNRSDPIYQNTRRFVLSKENPYYMWGPVINGTGGAHLGPGMAWPMSLIVGIMTTDDDNEIIESLRQLLSTTDNLGLMHESISSQNAAIWTRQWFSWANGLFGQMLLDLRNRKPHLLSTSFQDDILI